MDQNAFIEPDSKNWTWVLERQCPDCGFDASGIDVAAVGDHVRRIAADWFGPLGRADVRERPLPTVWSVLEYGCHVRDVFVIFDGRLQLMLTVDHPQFQNWDQDQTALDSDYGAQDPLTVRAELAVAAEQLAARFDTVTGDQWLRTGARSDGALFTIESLARYLLHDPIHHLWDVR